MKKKLYFLPIAFLLLTSRTMLAQPANDHPCDAQEIILDTMAMTFNLSLKEATADPGEEMIAPPLSIDCTRLDGMWCGDPAASDLAISKSIWFKFIATTEEGVFIDLCSSNFDTQMALYRFTDCADFSTYELIYAVDDNTTCGVGAGAGKASNIRTACLEIGAEYLILVDEGLDAILDPAAPQDVAFQINTSGNIDPGPISIWLQTKNPICPGGTDGFVKIDLISGIPPIQYNWSNGATTKNLLNVPAGVYGITVTDNCGLTFNGGTFEVKTPSAPDPIVLASLPNEVVHPRSCGDAAYGGQLSVLPNEGRGPFSYEWSNGDSLAFIHGLPDGVYTLTITDFCNTEQLVQSYSVGMHAGEDIVLNTECGLTPIGLDHAASGGAVTALTYSTDQSLSSGIACRGSGAIGQSATWRSFDLAADFNLTDSVDLAGVEVFISSLPNYVNDIGVQVKFSLFSANTPFLDDPDLLLTGMDSFETFIPIIPEYTPYIIPFKTPKLAANTILAVRLETLTSSGDGHRLDFASNTSPTLKPTYISSIDCGILQPISLDSIGFEQELVMNLLLLEEGGLTYEWSGPVDDPSSPTPIALGTESQTYQVTITDMACGLTVVDEVHVSCNTVSTQEAFVDELKVAPNPSSGFFRISSQTALGEVHLQVFDLQGQPLYDQNWEGNNGGEKTLDLSGWAKGIYLLKANYKGRQELHRLVIL